MNGTARSRASHRPDNHGHNHAAAEADVYAVTGGQAAPESAAGLQSTGGGARHDVMAAAASAAKPGASSTSNARRSASVPVTAKEHNAIARLAGRIMNDITRDILHNIATGNVHDSASVAAGILPAKPTPVEEPAAPTTDAYGETGDTEPAGLEHGLDHAPFRVRPRADGFDNLPSIPIFVGEAPEPFFVHRHVLLKSPFFHKALTGEYADVAARAITLPGVSPVIFHYIMTFLREGVFTLGRRPAGWRADDDAGHGESAGPASSRLRSRRLKRLQQQPEQERKRPKPTSQAASWNRRVSGPTALQSPPPTSSMEMARVKQRRRHRPMEDMDNDAPGAAEVQSEHASHQTEMAAGTANPEDCASGPASGTGAAYDMCEDSWMDKFGLILDVYICASRFAMEDMLAPVALAAIDMLEGAGTTAARPSVMRQCARLLDALGENDALLRVMLARLGVLQPAMWRQAPVETGAFLKSHPDVSALILREYTSRQEDDNGKLTLEEWLLQLLKTQKARPAQARYTAEGAQPEFSVQRAPEPAHAHAHVHAHAHAHAHGHAHAHPGYADHHHPGEAPYEMHPHPHQAHVYSHQGHLYPQEHLYPHEERVHAHEEHLYPREYLYPHEERLQHVHPHRATHGQPHAQQGHDHAYYQAYARPQAAYAYEDPPRPTPVQPQTSQTQTSQTPASQTRISQTQTPQAQTPHTPQTPLITSAMIIEAQRQVVQAAQRQVAEAQAAQARAEKAAADAVQAQVQVQVQADHLGSVPAAPSAADAI